MKRVRYGGASYYSAMLERDKLFFTCPLRTKALDRHGNAHHITDRALIQSYNSFLIAISKGAQPDTPRALRPYIIPTISRVALRRNHDPVAFAFALNVPINFTTAEFIFRVQTEWSKVRWYYGGLRCLKSELEDEVEFAFGIKTTEDRIDFIHRLSAL